MEVVEEEEDETKKKKNKFVYSIFEVDWSYESNIEQVYSKDIGAFFYERKSTQCIESALLFGQRTTNIIAKIWDPAGCNFTKKKCTITIQRHNTWAEFTYHLTRP